MTIGALLLAAGRSSRFGADKLLQPLPDGTPMALAAARQLRAADLEFRVCLRPEQTQLRTLLENEGFHCILSSHAGQGMGATLADGVAATTSWQGWLVALADMPAVKPATLRAVYQALHTGALIAAPVYGEKRGHPVGFAAALRARLLRCHGDRGARDLLMENPDSIYRVAVNDPGILFDIDTRAALAQLNTA